MGLRRIAWLLGILVLLLAGCSQPHEFSGTVLDDPQPAAELVGMNYDGRIFHLSDQQGKVVLIFFGYTFCPDVCPLTLAEIKSVYQELSDEGINNLSFVFVSVDPECDTLDRLSEYIPAFYGIRIEGEALEAIKKDL